MLHIDGFALPRQLAIKDGVQDIVLRRITKVQIKIIRADPIAPISQRKAEIIARAG